MCKNCNGFVIRDVVDGDLDSVLVLLGSLTVVQPLSASEITAVFRARRAAGWITKVAAESNEGRVIGTASLLIEQKYSHGGACVGHVEDVVTDVAYRGRGVARALMSELCRVASERRCYKVILDCNEANASVYEKMGFRRAELQMRRDL